MDTQHTRKSNVTKKSQQLVRAYQEVLRTISDQLPFGVPETLLPAKKDSIRRVLQQMAASASPSGWCGSILVTDLRAAYIALASFLPDPEAQEATRLHVAMANGDRSFLDSAIAHRVMERTRQIEQEATLLGTEFDHLRSDQEATDLIAEIDAFLAEFEQLSQVGKRSESKDLGNDWGDVIAT